MNAKQILRLATEMATLSLEEQQLVTLLASRGTVEHPLEEPKQKRKYTKKAQAGEAPRQKRKYTRRQKPEEALVSAPKAAEMEEEVVL